MYNHDQQYISQMEAPAAPASTSYVAVLLRTIASARVAGNNVLVTQLKQELALELAEQSGTTQNSGTVCNPPSHSMSAFNVATGENVPVVATGENVPVVLEPVVEPVVIVNEVVPAEPVVVVNEVVPAEPVVVVNEVVPANRPVIVTLTNGIVVNCTTCMIGLDGSMVCT